MPHYRHFGAPTSGIRCNVLYSWLTVSIRGCLAYFLPLHGTSCLGRRGFAPHITRISTLSTGSQALPEHSRVALGLRLPIPPRPKEILVLPSPPSPPHPLQILIESSELLPLCRLPVPGRVVRPIDHPLQPLSYGASHDDPFTFRTVIPFFGSMSTLSD